MKNQKSTKKFGRTGKKRRALMASLAEAFVEEGRVRTTEAKAKALRPYVEKLITKAREGGEHTRRQLESTLLGRAHTARKLVNEVGPRFQDRPGGYTRITKLPPRKSDGAYEAIIELIDDGDKEAHTADDSS